MPQTRIHACALSLDAPDHNFVSIQCEECERDTKLTIFAHAAQSGINIFVYGAISRLTQAYTRLIGKRTVLR